MCSYFFVDGFVVLLVLLLISSLQTLNLTMDGLCFLQVESLLNSATLLLELSST